MAITAFRQPPETGPATIMRALGDLNPSGDRLGSGRLDISAPMGLYRVALDEIDGPSSLDKAEFVGWRYILEGGGLRTGVADMVPSGEGRARFTSLARNEQADFLLQAAHLAEHLAESLPTDCEARILVVPSLYVSALWVTVSPPIFIPFLDAARPIRSVDAVAVRTNFLDDLVQRAQRARDHRPEEDGPAPSL